MEPATDSILSLLRKIAALASDPRAPGSERRAAADKLRLLMERHGLTEADLLDAHETWHVMTPAISHQWELKLAVQLIGMVQNRPKISVRKRGRLVEVLSTQAQFADILDAWQHYLPLFRTNWKRQVADERRRLQKRIRELPATGARAFYDAFHLYRQPDEDEEQREPTPEELEEALAARRMAADVEGEAWVRKAGNLDAAGVGVLPETSTVCF